MTKTREDLGNLFDISLYPLLLEEREDNALDVKQEACEMLAYEKDELLDSKQPIHPQGKPWKALG